MTKETRTGNGERSLVSRATGGVRRTVRGTKRFFGPRHRHAPGAAPGVLSYAADESAAPSKLHVIAFDETQIEDTPIDRPEDVERFINEYRVTWLNVDGVADVATVQVIGELFNLHPLAVEDVVHIGQRPKIEEYEDHLYIVARMPHQHNSSISLEQVSIFLGERFVVTFQETVGDCFDEVRKRIHAARVRMRKSGPDYLAYALMDAIVDHYFPILETYGDRLEDIEEQVLVRSNQTQLKEIHSIKRDMIMLRRSIWPMRDALNTVLRDQERFFSDDTAVYLRDCYDHTMRVLDLVESARDLCTDLASLHLTQVSNRMNEVMKVLTIIATIFIPLSFIAGLYGMNFNPEDSPWNMPELNWYYGYPAALAGMGITAAGLVFYMWKKGWILKQDD